MPVVFDALLTPGRIEWQRNEVHFGTAQFAIIWVFAISDWLQTVAIQRRDQERLTTS